MRNAFEVKPVSSLDAIPSLIGVKTFEPVNVTNRGSKRQVAYLNHAKPRQCTVRKAESQQFIKFDNRFGHRTFLTKTDRQTNPLNLKDYFDKSMRAISVPIRENTNSLPPISSKSNLSTKKATYLAKNMDDNQSCSTSANKTLTIYSHNDNDQTVSIDDDNFDHDYETLVDDARNINDDVDDEMKWYS